MNPDLIIIKENIDKLNKNMVNFLDYEKLQKGQNFYNHRTITDLSSTIMNSIRLFKETAHYKHIKISYDIEKEINIMADPYAVDRIINNL